MEKKKILLYICVVLTIINTLTLAYLITALLRQSPEDHPSSLLLPVSEPPHSDVYMPDSISLAGEKVPLHRIDVAEALKKELIVNSYLHSHTIQILKTAPRTFAIIEPILKAHGIPDDFKYLAVIESRLNPLIVSPAGAASVWQIMKATGKELGLEINNEVDERYHLEKSTVAAADYLRKSYEKFGSWTLAAASYNAGNHFLTKQMDQQDEHNYYNLLLGEETGRYVFRILALKQIMNHPERYNFEVDAILPPEEVTYVEVNTSIKNWAAFAHQHGITYKTLKRFNPWLRKNELHNNRHKTYRIAIPVNKELYRS